MLSKNFIPKILYNIDNVFTKYYTGLLRTQCHIFHQKIPEPKWRLRYIFVSLLAFCFAKTTKKYLWQFLSLNEKENSKLHMRNKNVLPYLQWRIEKMGILYEKKSQICKDYILPTRILIDPEVLTGSTYLKENSLSSFTENSNHQAATPSHPN